MNMPYTIRRTMLSDEELVNCYVDSLQCGCDSEFIRILENTLEDRGLDIPIEDVTNYDQRNQVE